jgi:hypothetical protein
MKTVILAVATALMLSSGMSLAPVAHAYTDQEKQFLAHLPAGIADDDMGRTAALNDGHIICSLMPAGPEQPGDRSTVVAEYISLAWKNYGVRANASDAKAMVNAALDYLCPT